MFDAPRVNPFGHRRHEIADEPKPASLAIAEDALQFVQIVAIAEGLKRCRFVVP